MNKWEKEVQQSLLDSEEDAIKELEKQYARALKDITDKVKSFQADIDLLDQALSQDGLDDATKALLQSQKRSKVYQQNYQKALKGQVSGVLDKLHGDNYTTIDKYLKGCYETGYIGTMYDIAKQGVPIIAPIDQAAAVKAILTDSKVSEGYYNHLGVSVGKLKKTITQEISRGIASGLPYSDIARNINNVSSSGLYNAKRIARTEGHRIQQTSTRDAQYAAKKKGCDVIKQWDASLDGRTRDSHARVDGEIRELDEKFSNGLMFPGDPSGSAAEVINCRCTSNTRAKWALDDGELQTLKERAEYFRLDKTENFEDFKRKFLEASDNPLDNSEETAIIQSREMFKKRIDSRTGFTPISEKRFDELTIEARKNGAVIERGTPEVEKHLNDMGAYASTIGDILMFRGDATVGDVVEETYHFMQNLHKLNDDKPEPLRTYLNEIDAKQYIINNAQKYKVPRVEVDLARDELEFYEGLLNEYNKG